jgi:hypothetical protein
MLAPLECPLVEGELIAAVDPSSTRTGWAIGRAGVLDAEVLASGAVVRPDGQEAIAGAVQMADQLQVAIHRAALQFEPKLDRIVVEVPGSAQAGRHGGDRSAQLSKYATAAGIQVGGIMRMVRLWGLDLVPSDRWGVKNKAARIRMATMDLPASVYDPAADTGDKDTGDAIALLRWWCRIRRAQAHGRK